MISIRSIALTLGVFSSALSCFAVAPDPNAAVKVNQIQLIGTHNSYHAGLAPSEAKLVEQKNPKLYQALEYRHRPLDEQLNAGVRQIELDIYADRAGGRYAHPMGPDAVAAAGLPKDPDFDPDGLMRKPGFRAMHVQDLDYRSTCQQLIACLQIDSSRREIALASGAQLLSTDYPASEPSQWTPYSVGLPGGAVVTPNNGS